MPYQTRWLVEGKVVLTEFSGNIDIEDLLENDKDLYRMVTEGEAPVHIICLASEVDKFPKQIAKINQSAEPYLRNEAMGWFVLVGLDNRLIRFIGSTVAQVTKLKMKQTDSLEEAVGVLKKIDPRLADVSV